MAILLLAGGCVRSFDPATYVNGLRVLAVRADPPEVAPGDTTMLTVLAVDPSQTGVATITAEWAACTQPPAPGVLTINPDCVNHDTAPYLVQFGGGLTLATAVPQVTVTDFAPPDATGGLYLPIRVRTHSPTDQVDAIYRLRLAQGMPRNNNPTLTAVIASQNGGAETPLDEATAVEVHALDKVTLHATLSADSVETYTSNVPGQPPTQTELPRMSWYATAGTFSEDSTGLDKPNTDWTLNGHVPAVGTQMDLWVVVRDGRGGTDWAHRTFVLR
jgi:hypothetical protein